MAMQQSAKIKNKDKNRIAIVVYIVLAVILLALVVGTVYARYVYSKARTGTVTSREFYFSSDYLTKSGTEYFLNPGTTGLTFTLKNHADALRYSENTVTYTVEVTGTGASVDLPGGTLNANQISDAAVTLSGLTDGQSYTVTATGRSSYFDSNGVEKTDAQGGYVEVLQATFTVLEASAKVYQHVANPSGSPYVVLTVWTENVAGLASIEFPDGLIPDGTDPALTGIENYNSGTGEYDGDEFNDNDSFAVAYASRTYRFFKAANYAGGDFTVTVDGKTAEPSVPS